ncbi:MAG: endo-alpha-N-acetylgalactosaminidase family protein, partial [Lachnospiraceae bacterium]
MHRGIKKILSLVLSAACILSSVSIDSISGLAAGENNITYTPWESTKYELEDGRTFKGIDGTEEVTIVSNKNFSGGKFVDTLDKCGQGAGIAVSLDVKNENVYDVSLCYAKGDLFPTGKVALYKNEGRVGYFNIVQTPSIDTTVMSNSIPVLLAPGDELSIRSDTGEGTEAVGRFDYLEVKMWGGKYEAEGTEFLSDSLHTIEAETASQGFSVDGFENIDKAGVKFPFSIPVDGTYILKLAYSRINYELADSIGVYVGDERRGTIDLKAQGIDVNAYGESDPIELDLKQGENIIIKVDKEKGDAGRLYMDYLSIQPKETESNEVVIKEYFKDKFFRVLVGDTFTIPVSNVAEGDKLTFSSSNEDVLTVDSNTGIIQTKNPGEAIITAQSSLDENMISTCKVLVVTSEEELAPSSLQYKAEDAELMHSAANPIIKTSSGFSGNKFVEIYDAGNGAAVRFQPNITEAGEYQINLRYAKGSMFPRDSVSIFVNNTKVGKFVLKQSPTLTTTHDSNVVSVSLKPGDTITIRKVDEDGDNSLFRFDYLNITPYAVIPVHGIQINEENVTIANKETYMVDYSVTPQVANGAIVWKSSNEAIAQVDGGIVRGIAQGTATITATSLYNSSISASMTVTVSENDKIETLSSDEMTVMLDRNFPRVIEYKMNESGNTMEGNTTVLNKLKINGQDYKPTVEFTKISADTAMYTLNIEELDAIIKIQVKVEGTILKMDFNEIKESGERSKRIYTIEIPNHNLASASSRDANASFAGSAMESDITKTGDEFIDLTKDTNVSSPTSYNYAFISNGKVAAGIRSNAYGVSQDGKRVYKETVAEGTAFRTSIRSGSWVWRYEDYTKKFLDYEGKYGPKGELVTKTYEDSPNDEDLPLVYVVLSEDKNKSGAVDWQDAAIEFRKVMADAIGMDKIPDAVVQRLIMPQGGTGNYPFISSLDETKRVFLNTDGLGQIILNKYHNLGFWADFSVYDDHLGGLQDFKYFVDKSTEEYNGFVGVHSNFIEVFAKTNHFSRESIQMESDGITPKSKGYKAFGYYLHQCYAADDIWDALSKDRLRRMKEFKNDVPNLGFIYSDVYSNSGWRGKQLAQDYKAADLAYFVEWPYQAEDDAVWAHWAVEKSYSPANLKAYASDIARFIFNDTKDRWDNYADILPKVRKPNSCNLLMGADTTSYEGWVHDGVNQYDYIITKIFDNNLPTKYMQHFPILRMDKDEEGWATHIWFEENVEVFQDENNDNKRTIAKDGKVIYTEDSYLIPWDEGDMNKRNEEEEKELKLYHWNENGGTTTWELPNSWNGLSNVYVYRLTDQGKTDKVVVPVVNNSVTLEHMEARIPYVVYKGEATPEKDVSFGDGSFVKDPGFNSGRLDYAWSLEKGDASVKKNDIEGDEGISINNYKGQVRNYELIIDALDETQVSQTITGLTPGEYAASVMVEVEQGKTRKASIFVDCGDKTVSNYADQSVLRNYDRYDSKVGTYMLRMRVVFTVPEGENSAVIRLHAEEGDGKVRFDNVRVYDTTTPIVPETAQNVVLYQDFESALRPGGTGNDKYKATYEGWFPFNLGASGGYRESRTMIQSRHDPYTQNNTDPMWDTTTLPVDFVLDGQKSLSTIHGSIGSAFQTSPQAVRFKEGHTYRVSFLYQTNID